MFKIKVFTSLLLIATVLFAQVGIAAAAPQTQDATPITGTIQSINLETDTIGATSVLVTIADESGETQTVRLSVDTAIGLGLVALDPVTNEPIADTTQYGTLIEIDPTTVLPDEEPVEESYHPLSKILATFFEEDASVIDEYHNGGFGFGLIAQSLWMSQNLGGDASLAGQILEAKQSGDYSALFPEGTENIPTNWGQFKKEVSEKKNNLGVVVSNHANNDDTTEQPSQPENGHGNGNGNPNKNNQGNGNNNGNGKNK
ncbi:MAG: hypothetical protein IPP66_00990 [Anaerolineales bacterium]|nr:hypothetical protein [Anaerolineales bacterium]